MHPDVTAVVQELDAHRARFESFCRSLSEEQLKRPVPRSTWVVRDFISHLATIDGPVGEMFLGVHEGRDTGVRTPDGVKWDVDRWNDRQVEERRAKTVDDILAEAASSRSALHALMAQLTAEDIEKTLKFGGNSKRPPSEVRLLDYLGGWNKHDPMHVIDMVRALPEVITADLEAWFDDPVIQGYQAAMNKAGG